MISTLLEPTVYGRAENHATGNVCGKGNKSFQDRQPGHSGNIKQVEGNLKQPSQKYASHSLKKEIGIRLRAIRGKQFKKKRIHKSKVI